jgi:hypothetical protein
LDPAGLAREASVEHRDLALARRAVHLNLGRLDVGVPTQSWSLRIGTPCAAICVANVSRGACK